MGTFVRRMVYVVGVCALLVGAGAAWYVGPGDVVRFPGTTVAGGAPVAVVPWDLLGYTGTTLHVRAEATPGPVFVGAAHPVDVASYLGGTRTATVRAVARTGDLTVSQSGDAQVPAPKSPGTATFWSAKQSGGGEQALAVPLTGVPVSVVVLSPSRSSVSLGLGATVPGAYRLALVVAGCGLLLVLGAAFWTLRRRRSHRRAAAHASEGDGTAPSGQSAPGGPDAAGPQRSAGLLLAVVAVAATSGCLAMPQATPAASTGAPGALPAKAALAGDPAEAAQALVADYDRRNNAVIAAMAKGADVARWAEVDGGSVLLGDRYTTVLSRQLREPADGIGLVESAGRAYVPGFSAYPMTVLVETTRRAADKPKDKATATFAVYQRHSVTAPWKQVADAFRDASAPPPAPPGRVDPLTAAERKAVVAVFGAVVAYLGKGTAPGFTPSTTLAEVRKLYAHLPEPNVIATTDCFPAVKLSDALASTTVVPTSTGHLLVLDVLCDITWGTNNGAPITWIPAYAAALNTTTGSGVLIHHNQRATVVLAMDARGKVTALGANSMRVPFG